MDAVDGEVSSSEIKVPGRKTLKNGMKCGEKEGRVQVRTWAEGASSDDRGKLETGDPGDLRLRDRQLITIAFVPEGTEVPPPPSASQLDSLTDLGPTQKVPVTGGP